MKQYQKFIALRAIADEYGVSVRFLCGGKKLDTSEVICAMYSISQLCFSYKSTFEDTAGVFGCTEAYASHNARSIMSLKTSDQGLSDQTDRIAARAEVLDCIMEPVYALSEADKNFFFVLVDAMFEVCKIPVSDFLDKDFSTKKADTQRSILVYLSQRFAPKKLQNAISEILSFDVNVTQERSEETTTAMSRDQKFKKMLESIADLILATSSK